DHNVVGEGSVRPYGCFGIEDPDRCRDSSGGLGPRLAFWTWRAAKRDPHGVNRDERWRNNSGQSPGGVVINQGHRESTDTDLVAFHADGTQGVLPDMDAGRRHSCLQPTL